LGTVIGMIDSFMQYEQQGVYVNAGHLASGAWQALISTATGLALGAVAVMAHHFLVGRIRSVVQEMEWLGQELIVVFTRVKHESIVALNAVGEESNEDVESGERTSEPL